MFLKIATFLGTAALCSWLAYANSGRRGLVGAAVGTAGGCVLCAVSYGTSRWVRRAQGREIVQAMYGGLLASFALMAVFILAVAQIRRDLLEPAALTALALYLTWRFLDVFQMRGGLPRRHDFSKGNGRGNGKGGAST